MSIKTICDSCNSIIMKPAVKLKEEKFPYGEQYDLCGICWRDAKKFLKLKDEQ